MKRSRKRLVLTLGLSLVFLVAAAAAAVAMGGGGSGGGSSQEAAGDSQVPVAARAADPQLPAEGRSDGGSGDGVRVPVGREDRSHEAHLDPAGRSEVERARVVALERAAGFDPHKLKRVPHIPYGVRVEQGEALPCTSPRGPINFEVFSVGPSVAGVPLEGVERRCGGSPFADEQPANFVNYIYGRCEISEGGDGCMPPLEIQTWPACQRALADYSYDGKPMEYRRLPDENGAEVVEILLDGRIEVYTKDSTVVIFSEDPALAEKALTLLRVHEAGQSPPIRAGEIEGEPEEGLAPPVAGATEGELSCRS